MFNFVTKQPYSGNNAQILAETGYSSPYFLTFKQAKDSGRMVRKGEKGITLVRIVTVEERDAKGKLRRAKKPKYFTVFNVEQTDEVAA